MLTNQKGEGATPFFVGVLILMFAMVLVMKHDFHNRTKRMVYSNILVQKLRPSCADPECKTKRGTYAIPTADDGWWYFDFIFEPSGSGSNSYTQYGNSLPLGGTWSKGTSAPRSEDVEEEEGVAVPEEDGNPMTPEEAAVVESNSDAESTTETSTESPSDTSSDSGSGDGGGGDGGGGD